MLTEIVLAIIQAATEFLPISSSGHLALFSNILSEPNLFFFTTLHLASLIAVLIFTRKEIAFLFTFKSPAIKLWKYLILATIPAALVGFFAHDSIKAAFSNYLFLSIAFFLTAIILFITKFAKGSKDYNFKNTFFMGLFQILALFPGVSRSGMTISAGLFTGLDKESAAKFSFLLFIPLAIAAFALELGEAYISISLIISFIVCLLLSLVFLNLLVKLIKKGHFWLFSFYCLAVSIISLALYFYT